MKPFHALPLALFLISSLSFAGTRTGNGGSGLLCKNAPLEVVEYRAQRDAMEEIPQDREIFIQRILTKIPNPVARDVVRSWWDIYGDSETWPEADLESVDVHHFDEIEFLLYPKDGIIPRGTSHVRPDCDRILISYFTADSPTPLKLSRHYSMLSRAQKNVLELHEAIYRASRSLGDLSPPYPLDSREVRAQYFELLQRVRLLPTREVPDHVIRGWVRALLMKDPGEGVANQLRVLWFWSRLVYHGEY